MVKVGGPLKRPVSVYTSKFNNAPSNAEKEFEIVQPKIDGFSQLDLLGIGPLVISAYDSIQRGKGLHRGLERNLQKHGAGYAFDESKS